MTYKSIAKEGPETVTVPNVVGMTLDEISEEYPDYKFEVSYEESDEVEAGRVIKQTPSEGRVIKKSQVIKITVSN